MLMAVMAQTGNFSEFAEACREQANLATWRDVAAKADISEGSIYRILSDKTRRDVRFAMKTAFAQALGFDSWPSMTIAFDQQRVPNPRGFAVPRRLVVVLTDEQGKLIKIPRQQVELLQLLANAEHKSIVDFESGVFEAHDAEFRRMFGIKGNSPASPGLQDKQAAQEDPDSRKGGKGGRGGGKK